MVLALGGGLGVGGWHGVVHAVFGARRQAGDCGNAQNPASGGACKGGYVLGCVFYAGFCPVYFFGHFLAGFFLHFANVKNMGELYWIFLGLSRGGGGRRDAQFGRLYVYG